MTINNGYENFDSILSHLINIFIFLSDPVSTASRVTLINHSIHSGFKEVLPAENPLNSPFYIQNRPQANLNTMMTTTATATATNGFDQITPNQELSTKEENLLASERTHFKPIKQTYLDGYSFEISNELSEVNFERSASGTLYLDSDIYREYYLYADENKQTKQCGALKNQSNGDDHNNDTNNSANSCTQTTFVLKFCVKQNEKYCQTDDREFYFDSENSSFEPTKKLETNIFNNSLELSNCYKNELYNNNNNNLLHNNNIKNKNYYNETTGYYDDNEYNKWAVLENRRNSWNTNFNNSLWNNFGDAKNDVVSMPANRLLKDELMADGDEILSDINQMQNLYMNGDEKGTDNFDSIENEVLKIRNKEKVSQAHSHDLKNNLITENINNSKKYNDADGKQIYKLISDLFKPERAQSLAQVLSGKYDNFFGPLTIDEMCFRMNLQRQDHQPYVAVKHANDNNLNENVALMAISQLTYTNLMKKSV